MSRDIYCHLCGEPVEIDYLHDVAADHDVTFSQALEAFRIHGCPALDSTCNPQGDKRRAYIAGIAADLLGDDVDGIASMMDDAEYMGMFD